jgi:hypothetical protein
MLTETYAAAQIWLELNGYKKEEGMPLFGVRFSSPGVYAIVMRIGDGKYETSFYQK